MKNFYKMAKLKNILQKQTNKEWLSPFDENVLYVKSIIDLSDFSQQFNLGASLNEIYFENECQYTIICPDFSDEQKWLKIINFDAEEE